jgi:hypothetical protein
MTPHKTRNNAWFIGRFAADPDKTARATRSFLNIAFTNLALSKSFDNFCLQFVMTTNLASLMSERFMTYFKAIAAAATLAMSTSASAATLNTIASPTTAGNLPSTISAVGGIVFDIIGLNDARVVAQAAASTLFQGNTGPFNPLEVGSLSGFSSAVVNALGGGIKQMAVRISLYDGDSASGNFDFNDNFLTVNNGSFGNFSTIETQETTSTGTPIGNSIFGFDNERLNTGFFLQNDATILAGVFAEMSSTGELRVRLIDNDPGDQFYDFRRGIDQSLINVGSGPVVTPPPNPNVVPLPAAAWMLMAGLGGLASMRRRQKATAA